MITHTTLAVTATVATDVADSSQIVIGEFSTGMVHVPSGSEITTLTWYAASAPGGTFVAANDGSGAITQTVAAGRCYALPTSLAGANSIKAAGNAAGTITVVLKD